MFSLFAVSMFNLHDTITSLFLLISSGSVVPAAQTVFKELRLGELHVRLETVLHGP